MAAPCTTICPRCLDPYCIVNYYINWAKTSWTYSTPRKCEGKVLEQIYILFLSLFYGQFVLVFQTYYPFNEFLLF